MSTALSFIGIDVHQHSLSAAVRGARVRDFAHDAAGVAALLAWAVPRLSGAVRAVCESSGPYSQKLAWLLKTHGVEMAIVPPKRVRANAVALGRASKTDRLDAAVILDFAMHTAPRPYSLPAAAEARLTQLLGQRRDCQQEARRWLNRLHALTQLPTATDDLLATPQRIAALLNAEAEQLRLALHALIKSESALAADYALLTGIPGIGPETALALLARREILRTRNAKQLTAYAGLAPAHKQSGTSLHGRSHLPHDGDSELRRLLYMAALSAARVNPPLVAFYTRLRAEGKPTKHAHCAVARKLLLQAQAILCSGQPYDPHHSPTRD